MKRLLAVVPDSVPGRRDRAIVLTLVLTGRRRSEVLNLKARDIECDEERVFYQYRGQGGKVGRRELPLLATATGCGRTSSSSSAGASTAYGPRPGRVIPPAGLNGLSPPLKPPGRLADDGPAQHRPATKTIPSTNQPGWSQR